MKSINQVEVKKGQIVLVRADFDVPLDEKGRIDDDFRLEAALPTIKLLLEREAKIILLAHLGRPQGKTVKDLRLEPVAQWLKKRVGQAEYLKEIDNFNQIGERIKKSPHSVFLLENIRFYSGEEENNPQFTQKLANLGEIFVNDAFAVSHRQHSSIVGLTQHLPSFAGQRLVKEVQVLNKALSFKKDLVVVLGGLKTEGKIHAIEGLIKIGAIILLGGGLGNTFLAAVFGKEKVDGTLIEEENLPLAKKFLSKLDKEVTFSQIPGQTTKIWLPLDVIVARKVTGRYTDFEEIYFWPPLEGVIKGKKKIYDIGPKTIKEYVGILKYAKGIIFNGPLGKFENPPFEKGTKKIFQAIAQSPAFSLAGGGNTLAALEKFNLCHKIDYASTGGGAMLEYIAKGTLPGIEALNK